MVAAVNTGPSETKPPSDAPRGKLAAQVAKQIEEEVIARGWPVGQSIPS